MNKINKIKFSDILLLVKEKSKRFGKAHTIITIDTINTINSIYSITAIYDILTIK